MDNVICPKQLCTGCAACFNICPNRCIEMVADEEGFLRPQIDPVLCDGCDLCKIICPIAHPQKTLVTDKIECYACWNKDEIARFQSASGGVFSALAESILNEGGIVFGAAFDENMQLKHMAIDRKEDLERLRSSKYLQSNIGNSYLEVLKLLRGNKKVLFSGTPCQIAGLDAVVGKERELLFTCDLICFGVPSAGLFTRYVKYLEERFVSKLVRINFRHKQQGWKLWSTAAAFSNGRQYILRGLDNSFINGFLNYFDLRPACYRCLYTKINRQGDITLGDFWGIGEFASFCHRTRNGISLVLVNSKKGEFLFQKSMGRLNFEKRTLKEALHNRRQLNRPMPEPAKRRQFFADYQRLDYQGLAKKHLIDKGLKRLVKSVIPRAWIVYLRKRVFKPKNLS